MRGFMFCCPSCAPVGAQASKLGVQGVISVRVHTQGAALGYTLLPFLAPMLYASVP